MKKIFVLISLITYQLSWANCLGPIDVLVVGDSQTGATWSKSYFGNFLQSCLEGTFTIYGKGGSTPGSWLGKGGLDQIEIIQRDQDESHLNIGAGESVPLCKKRIASMLETHQPKKVLFFFGDNHIASSDEEIIKETELLMKTVNEKGVSPENCFFLTPTFEMEIKTKRNVSRKNLLNTERITQAIRSGIQSRCQLIDGVEIMKSSSYFDGKELLKRVQVEGKIGCAGAASNDNIHICGEAAKDLALKICQTLNSK
jgi:hypothetical protein